MPKPRYVSPVSDAEMNRGDGDKVIKFIEHYCRSTKETFAARVGERLTLRPWQKHDISALYARRADGRRKHRVGLYGMPRKNGKSAIGSGLALHGLLLGPNGAEVYSCAADREQARIVFGVAKRMVELDPELSEITKLYRDAIEIPESGSVYRVLSSEAFTKEGLSPTLVVYDELHAAPNDELWDVMNLGTGARVDPLIVAITTAGVRTDTTGQDSICYRMYQHGLKVAAGEVDDPSFFFRWYEAPEGADHREVKTWRLSNPGFGDIIDPEDFESAIKRTREPEFRTKRCNQWVASDVAWLPAGAWEGLAEPRQVPAGTQVALGFDGSYNRDATALIACTLEDEPYLFTLGVWERPLDADDDWTVPRGEVRRVVEQAFSDFRVERMYLDPALWADEMAEWSARFGDVVLAFPNTPQRMSPACAEFYAAVMERRLTHDSHPTVARHLRNAVVKEHRGFAFIVKERNTRKIDAAVASVLAFQAHSDAIRADPEVEVQVMFV